MAVAAPASLRLACRCRLRIVFRHTEEAQCAFGNYPLRLGFEKTTGLYTKASADLCLIVLYQSQQLLLVDIAHVELHVMNQRCSCRAFGRRSRSGAGIGQARIIDRTWGA